MKIIGLGHYSRTGKDSFANHLIAALDKMSPLLYVEKKPFAWKLKQVCYELYEHLGLRKPEFYETPEGEKQRNVVLPRIGKTPVQIWIDFGTPAVREQVYDKTWIDYVLRIDHGLDVMIVPDVRFPNEVEAMRDHGAHLIKVVRPGYGPRKSVADRALLGFKGWDNVIGEEGTMDSLKMWAERYAEWILGGEPVVRSPESIEKALSVEVIEPWDDDNRFSCVPVPGCELRVEDMTRMNYGRALYG